jgi:succinate dehydrogenase / fumarate reductase cytochrome b subunit
LWTFLITWGITLSPLSQNGAKKIALFLMGGVAFLGLIAIWGTYWINLKQ